MILFEILFLKHKAGYNAEFGSGEGLSPWNKGWRITGTKSLTKELSHRNFLLIGGTGSGKTSIAIIPTIMNILGSMIINDPSGEILTKSGGFLHFKKVIIKILDWANPSRSWGFNPLLRANSTAEINKLAMILVRASLSHGKGDPFWEIQAISVLSFTVRLLKHHDKKFQNLANVLHLVNTLGANPSAVDAAFSDVEDESLLKEYMSFVAYDQKVQAGVLATCKAALHFVTDPDVQRVTARDNLDFNELRQKQVAVFIQSKVADQKLYAPLTSILYEQLFSFIMDRIPNRKEQDIFLVIDECSSLYLSTLQIAAANVRKYRCGMLLALQDFNQLVDVYGRNEAISIKSNCYSQLYLPGMSHEQSKELSDLLGRYDHEDESGRRILPLRTHDDLRTMRPNQGLLLLGPQRPIIARLTPYYRQYNMNRRSKIPVPGIEPIDANDGVPLLPLIQPVA